MIEGLKERFAIIRADSGLNVKQFASSLGMEATTVSSIESGKREPSKEVLHNLAIKYAVSLNWIFTGVGEKTITNSLMPELMYNKDFEKDNFFIPLLDQNLSAGTGCVLPDNDDASAYIPAPKNLARYGTNLAALYVEGDSMQPTLNSGDMIVCDSCGWNGEGIYAIQMDGCGFVKRISRRPGRVVIISDNPIYEPFEIPLEDESVRIIGRVQCVLHVLHGVN